MDSASPQIFVVTIFLLCYQFKYDVPSYVGVLEEETMEKMDVDTSISEGLYDHDRQ